MQQINPTLQQVHKCGGKVKYKASHTASDSMNVISIISIEQLCCGGQFVKKF